MASVLHKVSKQYIPSVNTPDFMDGNWLINPNMSVVEGYAPKYWIITGNTLSLADEETRELIDKLEKFDGLTVESAIAKLQLEINTYRDYYIDWGVIYMGHQFDIDSRARENIIGMCSAVSLGVEIPPGFTWRSKLNEDVPMNTQQLVAFGLGALTFVSTCFAASWAHKDYLSSIRETATLEELADYDYTLNWPNKSLDGSNLQAPQNPPEEM